jgi:hypothetical protein
MIDKLLAFSAAAVMAATPCLSAELPGNQDAGARRSGAVAGAYLKVPLDGPRAEKPRAGLRLSMVHDYRSANAQTARVIEADTFDLRLTGRKPALFIAGQPVGGKDSKRSNLGPIGSTVTLVVLVAAAVGGYYIYRAIDDSGEE